MLHVIFAEYNMCLSFLYIQFGEIPDRYKLDRGPDEFLEEFHKC